MRAWGRTRGAVEPHLLAYSVRIENLPRTKQRACLGRLYTQGLSLDHGAWVVFFSRSLDFKVARGHLCVELKINSLVVNVVNLGSYL